MIRPIKNQKGSMLYIAAAAAIAFAVIISGLIVASKTFIRKSGSNLTEKMIEEHVFNAAKRTAIKLKDEAKKIDGVKIPESTLLTLANSISIEDSGCDFDVIFHNADQDGTVFTVPMNKYFPAQHYDHVTNKKIYNYTVEADCAGRKKVANVFISLYGVSAFNWTLLSQFPLSFAPGRPFRARGRIHSNMGFQIGGYGGVYFMPDDLQNPLDIAISTSGEVWSMFKIANLTSGWDYNYYHNGFVIATPTKSVKFCGSSGDPSDPDCYLKNSVPSNVSVCGDADDETCWTYTDPISNFTTYNVRVDTDNDAFEGRIKINTEEISPFWAKALRDPDTNEVDPHRIIEPGSGNDTSVDQQFKFWYQSQIKFMDGKSVDENGNEITTGVFSTSNLTDVLGIFDRQERKYYSPQDGRLLNVTFVDFDALKTVVEDSVNYPEFANVKHIYVGGYSGPTGEVQFPAPGCRCDKASATWQPVAYDENGNSTLTGSCSSSVNIICDAANIGEVESVMTINAQEIPSGGFQLTTPNLLMVQGDTNTVTTNPLILASDSESTLSNSWFTQSGAAGQGWDSANVTGPKPGTATTQYYASISGGGHGLSESWGGNLLEKHSASVNMFRPKDWPPPAGSQRLVNWHFLAWPYYYGPATHSTYFYDQVSMYDQTNVAILIGKYHVEIIEKSEITKVASTDTVWADSIPDSFVDEFPPGEDDPTDGVIVVLDDDDIELGGDGGSYTPGDDSDVADYGYDPKTGYAPSAAVKN